MTFPTAFKSPFLDFAQGYVVRLSTYSRVIPDGGEAIYDPPPGVPPFMNGRDPPRGAGFIRPPPGHPSPPNKRNPVGTDYPDGVHTLTKETT